MSILLNAITDSMQLLPKSQWYSSKTEKNNPNIHIKHKKPQTAKTILKKNKARNIVFPDFKKTRYPLAKE